MGVALNKLKLAESFRGNMAAWLLIAFGMAYLIWGLRQAYRKKSHLHTHAHTGEQVHSHAHSHSQEHVHVHSSKTTTSVTPWALFVIFVFGPCEPLIPVLMYPAHENSLFGLVAVTCVFGVVTIATMLGVVMLARAGVNFLPLAKVQRFSHVIAGATICLCGFAIQFLGL
jgi:sulfite exporter TauE/SafE